MPPLTFRDGFLVMPNFAQTLFELGQIVPINEKVDPASHLPGKTIVPSSVFEIVKELRNEFLKTVHEGFFKDWWRYLCRQSTC